MIDHNLTAEEKLELVEKWIFEAVQESRSGEIRINIGGGHVTFSRNGDWYMSDGSCYPNEGWSDTWEESSGEE